MTSLIRRTPSVESSISKNISEELGQYQREWFSYIMFYFTGYHLFFHLPSSYGLKYEIPFGKWKLIPLPETKKQEEEIPLPLGLSIQNSDFGDREVHFKLKWNADHLSYIPFEFNVTMRKFSVLHIVSYKDQGVRLFSEHLLIPSFIFYKNFYQSQVQLELKKQARMLTELQATAILEAVATGKLLETHPLVAIARTRLGDNAASIEESLKAQEKWNDCYSPKWSHRRLEGSFGSRTGG
jgi:hypothetical protein